MTLILSLGLAIILIGSGAMYVVANREEATYTANNPKQNTTPPPKPVMFEKAPTAPTPQPESTVTTPAPQKKNGSIHRAIPILEYHHIRAFPNIQDTAGYWTSVSPDLFDTQMATLHTAGYSTISFQDYIAGKANSHSVIITFDDGDADAYTEAFPILKKNGFSSVFYLISSFLDTPDYLTTDQVKEMSNGGMAIGAHTQGHFNLTQIDEANAIIQINQSKIDIESIVGKSVADFCYPFGGYTDHLADLVKQAGYESAVTTDKPLTTNFSSYFELPRLAITMKDNSKVLLQRVARVEDWN